VYNEEESKRTEQAYLSPEIERQRQRTIEVIDPQPGEKIVDVGCGPGLLAHELAPAVGDTGRIIGADSSAAMLELAKKRCAHLPNIEFVECDATDLEVDEASADLVTCTQVLLYVTDVEKALEEMFRILKPGGRVIIMETDWRGTVLHSYYEDLTEKIIEAWDRAVPSPRGGFSMAMMAQSAEAACEQGIVTASEAQSWLEELSQLGAEDAYFFCVNRFLFSAVK
jgi:ubiquinone/menaquinone biosynthesis C-methylase UbiE